MAALLNSLCNDTFASANATGIFSFQPRIQQPVNNVSWAITLYENASYVQTAIWFNTGGANYSKPVALGYDSCIIGLPRPNALSTYRALSDDGDCSQAFDDACISALTSIANTQANTILANTGPDNINTMTFCEEIGKTVNTQFPAECNKYFNVTSQPDFYSSALSASGSNPSFLYEGQPCVISETASDRANLSASSDVFWSIGEHGVGPTVHNYDEYANSVWPFLQMFVPAIAKRSTASERIGVTYTQAVCLRDQNITPGSRVPPKPVNPSKGSSLSKGDIAGIVIGSSAGGVLLLATICFVFRRLLQRQIRQGNDKRNAFEIDGRDQMAEADSAAVKHDTQHRDGIGTIGRRTELPTGRDAELPVEHDIKHEVMGDVPEVGELPANEAPRT